MQVQDAIHGYIYLNDLEEAVLDTPEMQRLRRIRQLGFSNLVYPSATHTRFEHSLGAMYLADKFAQELQLGEGRAQELRLAALFHDLGHGPFSHVTDAVYHKHDLSHEHFSKKKIRDSEIGNILQDHAIHPKRVTKLIDGKSRLGSIIAGHIDVDRMDYLMRDAYYTGVAYGTIDADTIVRAAQIQDKELVFSGKYLNALESLLTARYLMLPTVYTHRTSRVAARMFREAFRRLNAEEDIPVEELTRMDEPEILTRMRNSKSAAGMINRLLDRRLYKIAAKLPETELTETGIEERLLDETGLEEGKILADHLKLDDSKAYDVPVQADGELTSLHQLSELPDTLQQALSNRSELRIYTEREHVDAVADAADSVL